MVYVDLFCDDIKKGGEKKGYGLNPVGTQRDTTDSIDSKSNRFHIKWHFIHNTHTRPHTQW